MGERQEIEFVRAGGETADAEEEEGLGGGMGWVREDVLEAFGRKEARDSCGGQAFAPFALDGYGLAVELDCQIR